MANPFIGQLSLVGFNFAPYPGWALAAGQILAISPNTALFSLLGTLYGGDGRSNFGLPNLQGKVAIGMGESPGLNQYFQGEVGGTPTVTLLSTETPNHTHSAMADPTSRGVVDTPAGHSFADSTSGNLYSNSTSPLVTMNPSAINQFGGNQPHNNMMPFLGLNWIIALQGVFPQRP
jgi:microcystin-dependent protein